MKCSNCGNNKDFRIKETNTYTAESSENKLENLDLYKVSVNIYCKSCGEQFDDENEIPPEIDWGRW